MFLVVGITGRTGAAVARHLLGTGQRVRAFTRDRGRIEDWTARGVEAVVGDLADPRALARALDGVAGAFVMLPPVYAPSRDFAESTPLIAAYGAALKAVALPRLVVLSSNGAERARSLGAITPLALLERELAGLPYPQACIRPGAFYENFLSGLRTARDGTFPVFYARTDERHPMSAIEDIGALAARLLTGPAWSGKRVIELGSMVSADELAAQLGAVLGHAVAARALPRETWTDTLERMGLPKGHTWAFEAIYDGVNARWIGFGAPGAERVEGTTRAREVFAAAREAADKT